MQKQKPLSVFITDNIKQARSVYFKVGVARGTPESCRQDKEEKKQKF